MSERLKIYAPSMLVAQSVQLTAEQRAGLVARADRIREITGETGRQTLNVPVHDVHQPTVILGHMAYSL
jgi:hypothetical protein